MGNSLAPSTTDSQQLLALFEQGHYSEVETRARELIERFPAYGFGWKVLGVVLRRQGQIAASLKPMQKAAELLADDAETHSNLGVVLMNQGLLVDAVASYRRALAINPDYIQVYDHLGLTLMTLGELTEAEQCYRRVLALSPDYPDAHYNLGRIFQEQGRLAEAESCYRRVLIAHPELSDVYSNLAWVLHWQGQWIEAELCYQQALTLNPHDIKAYSNLGLLLQRQGRLTEALDCYQCALEINPQFVEIHNNMGIVFHELGLTDEAQACYQHALAINPNDSDLYNNLGLTLQKQGRLTKAEASYRHALAINPNNAEAYNNLGVLFQENGQLIDALASYQQALTNQPNHAQAHDNLGTIYKNLAQIPQAEAHFRSALAINPDYLDAHSHLLLVMNDSILQSPADYLIEAHQYDVKVSNKVDTPFSHWYAIEQPERLRIGIVSGDLYHHPVGCFLADLLPELDDTCLELIAYPTHSKVDELTARIQTYFTEWKPLTGLNDAAAARLIHADGIHILIDLSGHTQHNRLPVFAWKPAPIQVSWLGGLASTGLTAMDYVLGDPYATPLKDAVNFSEQIWQLPESYRCFTVPKVNLEVNPLPALNNQFITFGCFNALNQINDITVVLWARILHAIPQSQLLLKNPQLNDAIARETIRQRFAELGIFPERLLLEGEEAQTEQFAAYHRVDISLDTFPPRATLSYIETLWMAVPVIICVGDRFVNRCAESILANVGLEDWITDDDDDYVATTVHFANDIEKLAVLRTQLRQQLLASPLFDTENFARQFEAALWSMAQP